MELYGGVMASILVGWQNLSKMFSKLSRQRQLSLIPTAINFQALEAQPNCEKKNCFVFILLGCNQSMRRISRRTRATHVPYITCFVTWGESFQKTNAWNDRERVIKEQKLDYLIPIENEFIWYWIIAAFFYCGSLNLFACSQCPVIKACRYDYFNPNSLLVNGFKRLGR